MDREENIGDDGRSPSHEKLHDPRVPRCPFLGGDLFGRRVGQADRRLLDRRPVQRHRTGLHGEPARGFTPDPKVLLFHSGKPHLDSGTEPNTWLPLHQASESPDRFGPELGFGNRLAELRPGRPIALIKHAHSGTNLYQDWEPGKDAADVDTSARSSRPSSRRYSSA